MTKREVKTTNRPKPEFVSDDPQIQRELAGQTEKIIGPDDPTDRRTQQQVDQANRQVEQRTDRDERLTEIGRADQTAGRM